MNKIDFGVSHSALVVAVEGKHLTAKLPDGTFIEIKTPYKLSEYVVDCVIKVDLGKRKNGKKTYYRLSPDEDTIYNILSNDALKSLGESRQSFKEIITSLEDSCLIIFNDVCCEAEARVKASSVLAEQILDYEKPFIGILSSDSTIEVEMLHFLNDFGLLNVISDIIVEKERDEAIFGMLIIDNMTIPFIENLIEDLSQQVEVIKASLSYK